MDIINNKYKILEKIGEGAFGSIYKGQNIRTQELVAIKVEPITNETKLLKNESIIYNKRQPSYGCFVDTLMILIEIYVLKSNRSINKISGMVTPCIIQFTLSGRR